MKPVICFGEALVDMLMTNNQIDDGLALPQFTQYPGGAPANAAVAVAKLGGDSYFIGQVGQDTFGDFLLDALDHYGVNTQFVNQTNEAKTALALVSLDKQGERSFNFYRDNTADLTYDVNCLYDSSLKPVLTNRGLFHFCSNTLTTESITEVTEQAVMYTSEYDNLISFDVNLRHNLWPTQQADIERVNRFVKYAHVVKFSKEEFDYLSQGNKDQYLAELFAANCLLIVVTNGGEAIEYFIEEYNAKLQPPNITAVDTTAAGDGFIGGFLWALSNYQQPKKIINDPQSIGPLIQLAAQCGAIAVSRKGAFPALATKRELLNFKES